MTHKLLVPSYILEGIKADGIREAKNDNETTGLLLGSSVIGATTVQKRYPLISKKGDGSAEDSSHVLKQHSFLAEACHQVYLDSIGLMFRGKTPSLAIYHSHPDDDGWSAADMKAFGELGRHIEVSKNRISNTSYVLYLVGEDKFLAVDHETKKIPILRI